ncbi:MAG: IS3 family transposase [Thermoplasmataceae archaeon]
MLFHNLSNMMSVRRISFISGIALSSYYYRSSARVVKRIDPMTERMIIEAASERTAYGYRRIWALLRNSGIHANRKTVRRVLKRNNLSLPAHKHHNRTKTRNLFRPSGPDQLWETDITYIPTESGMTYLMCIKDCFSKEWQGYHYSRSCMASDAIKSVEDAVMRAFDGEVPEGLVLRVDNGPQYIARKFREAMMLLGIRIEYIQKHTPEDNGNIESFHNSIKTDYIWPYEFRDFTEAKKQVEYAFTDYNTVRPHSSIMYLAPKEFRNRWSSDPGFRAQYQESLEKEKEKKRSKRENRRKMEVKANGI